MTRLTNQFFWSCFNGYLFTSLSVFRNQIFISNYYHYYFFLF